MNPITQSRGAYLSPVYRSIPAPSPLAAPSLLLAPAPSLSLAKQPSISSPAPASAAPAPAAPLAPLLRKLDELKVAYTVVPSRSEVECAYEAEDGPERCEFTLTPSSCDRTSGCIYLFKRITAQLGTQQQAQPQQRMFRCLPLPREMQEEKQASSNFLADFSSAELAASKSHEQQEQFCNALSGMLMRNEHVEECKQLLQPRMGMLNACVQRKLASASGEQPTGNCC